MADKEPTKSDREVALAQLVEQLERELFDYEFADESIRTERGQRLAINGLRKAWLNRTVSMSNGVQFKVTSLSGGKFQANVVELIIEVDGEGPISVIGQARDGAGAAT